jgi:hypothetical protein
MVSSSSTGQQRMDFAKALMFLRDDPQRVSKIIIGTGVYLSSVVLVGMPLLAGYFIRTIRRAAAGAHPALPDWDNWGELLTDGLKVMAMVAIHLTVVGLPLSVLLYVVDSLAKWQGSAGGPGTEPHPIVVLATLAIVGAFVLPLALYTPSAQIRYAMTGRLREALNVPANLAFIRNNLANYLAAFAVFMAANTLAQFGILACCIGILPTSFWAYSCFCHALGQTARLDASRT